MYPKCVMKEEDCSSVKEPCWKERLQRLLIVKAALESEDRVSTVGCPKGISPTIV